MGQSGHRSDSGTHRHSSGPSSSWWVSQGTAQTQGILGEVRHVPSTRNPLLPCDPPPFKMPLGPGPGSSLSVSAYNPSWEESCLWHWPFPMILPSQLNSS